LTDTNNFAAPTVEPLAHLELLPGETGYWQDGKLLVMTRETELPDRCIRCNLPADGYKLERRLSWHPGLVYALLFISPLVYFVVALIVRKRATIHVGLCERHRKRRKRAIATGWIASLAGFALIFGAFVVADVNEGAAALVFLSGVFAIIFGLLYGMFRAQTCSAKKIDKLLVRVAQIDRSYLESLPLWTERPR
jgi:hypothetical protein